MLPTGQTLKRIDTILAEEHGKEEPNQDRLSLARHLLEALRSEIKAGERAPVTLEQLAEALTGPRAEISADAALGALLKETHSHDLRLMHALLDSMRTMSEAKEHFQLDPNADTEGGKAS